MNISHVPISLDALNRIYSEKTKSSSELGQSPLKWVGRVTTPAFLKSALGIGRAARVLHYSSSVQSRSKVRIEQGTSDKSFLTD